MSTESTGFCLCGMAEDPPRPATSGSPSSPFSIRAEISTSLAIFPQAATTSASAAATPVTGIRLVSQGPAGVLRPSRAAKASISWKVPVPSSRIPCRCASATLPDSAAMVPAAPPHWRGSSAVAVSSRRPAWASPSSQFAARSPKVEGSECWARERATMGVWRWVRASSTRLPTAALTSRRMAAVTWVVIRIRAVSMMS